MTLRGPEAPHLRALPEARVPKYATPLRAHESGAPQARSLFRPTLQLGRLLVCGLRPANIVSFLQWGIFPGWGLSCGGRLARPPFGRPRIALFRRRKTYRVVTLGLAHGPIVAFGVFASLCFGRGGFRGLGLCLRCTARSVAFRPASHRLVSAMGDLSGCGLLLGTLVVSFRL
jgi:hypothetical protein